MTTAIVCAYSCIGLEALAELIDLGINVLALYTYEQKTDEYWFIPPATLAYKYNIPTYIEKNFNSDTVFNKISSLKPDLLFSFYFRDLIEARFLNIPRLGSYNLHGSLLPKYRGRCPINWAIINGETKTGLTLHAMDSKPDNGDIYEQLTLPIHPYDTAFSLTLRMSKASRILINSVIPKIVHQSITGTAQNLICSPTYFGKREPKDGLITFSDTAQKAFNMIRALAYPFPNAFLKNANKDIIKIFWAIPIKYNCPAGYFKIINNRVIIGFQNGALEIKSLHKEGIPSIAINDHIQLLKKFGLPQD